MKKLLAEILKEHDFKIINMPTIRNMDSYFAKSKNERKINYYLVLFVDNLLELDNHNFSFNSFFDEIKQLDQGYDYRMDKNLTMVICAERSSLKPDKKISEIIYKTEEDPYFFKKYVLTYTSQQVDLLNHEFTDYESKTELIYKLLNDHELFLAFKSAPDGETVYNLISKLFIKLPFLNLRNLNRQMDNLTKKINKSLNDEQTFLRDKAMEYTSVFNNMQFNNRREKILGFIGVDPNE